MIDQDDIDGAFVEQMMRNTMGEKPDIDKLFDDAIRAVSKLSGAAKVMNKPDIYYAANRAWWELDAKRPS